MKKILLIIAVVLCIGIASGALAVSYNNANNSPSATLTADKYLALDLGETSSAALQLVPGQVSKYTVQCNVTRSTTAPYGQLTITLTDGAATSLTHLNIAVYTDSNCTHEASTTRVGNVITISNIGVNTPYYITLSVDDEYATDFGGTLNISLTQQA